MNDQLAKQKRQKKEHKTATANVKKEIDLLHGKLNKIAGEDRSHLNRHLQWTQHTKQAEEALTAINEEIERLDSVPEEETAASRQKRSEWEEAKQHQSLLHDQLLKLQDDSRREQAAVQGDIHTARQKKERLQARHSKLKDLLEKIETPKVLGGNDKVNDSARSAQRETQRHQLEQDLENQIANFEQAWQESRYKVEQYAAQIQQLEASYNEQRLAERPLTPEGDLPGENRLNAATAAFRGPAFGTPESGGLRSHSGSLRHNEARIRSSSLQSGHSSNYVDFDDQDPAPPMPFQAAEVIRNARKRSGGSNAGSSGSNSQRDPASPVGGMRDSPLGKKHLVWNS